MNFLIPDSIKLTDNEIIKALECCIGDDEGRNCHLCPLYDVDDCLRVVCELGLDLIKRQQANISVLETEKENLRCVIDDLCNNTEYAKSEAVKEFAEKIYKFLCNKQNWNTLKEQWLDNGECDWLKQKLDKIKKEMVDENDEEMVLSSL